MCFAPQRRALFRHFFDIRTSKSGPRPSVFNTFDFEMCFAPQRRALFRHFFDIRTSKSGPRPSVFNTFERKHILKSKCTKYRNLGPLLEVAMSKKCTPLWREAHLEVKMHKTPQPRDHFLEVAMSKKCTPLWREAHLEGRMYKTHHVSDHFLEVAMSKKVHAVVARSTFPSKKAQNTPCSDHFWSLRCRVSKKCTPLWREADFEVRMSKTHHVRTTSGVWDVEFWKSGQESSAAAVQQRTGIVGCRCAGVRHRAVRRKHTTTFRSISGFALPFLRHSNTLLL